MNKRLIRVLDLENNFTILKNTNSSMGTSLKTRTVVRVDFYVPETLCISFRIVRSFPVDRQVSLHYWYTDIA